MKPKDKELLLKDLCARLPYGVKVEYNNVACEVRSIDRLYEELTIWKRPGYYHDVKIEDCKPYLLPMSSMTEEQKKEYEDALTYHDYVEGGWTIAKSFNNEYIIPYWFVDFCNKNYLDYRGLIPKGLAIDATGLNIY